MHSLSCFVLSKNQVRYLDIGVNILLFFYSSVMLGSVNPGNTRGGSIIVPLTSCFTGLESAV
jgi:hypothetical protein